MQGFNSTLAYNKEAKSVAIQTLPYLVAYYEQNITNFGYDKLSEDFNNQKAIIHGMLVGSKEATGKTGVKSTKTGEDIISPRYNELKFLESSKEFIVTNSSGKMGIVYSTGTTKVDALYDEIKVLDKKLGYYVVKSNSKYGVINSSGETVIHIEYDNIGVDLKDFQTDNIKNQYLLYDIAIPVCLNGKWGLFGVNGKKIVEPELDGIGCVNTDIKEKIVNNVLTIGDSEVIVFVKDEKYGGVSIKGEQIIPFMCDYIYSITSGGEVTYYMVYNNVDYKAMDYIKISKERLGYTEGEKETGVSLDNENNNSTEGNTNTNSNVDTNTSNQTNTDNNANTNTNTDANVANNTTGASI